MENTQSLKALAAAVGESGPRQEAAPAIQPLNVNLYSDEQLRSIIFRCNMIRPGSWLDDMINADRDAAAVELVSRFQFELKKRGVQ